MTIPAPPLDEGDTFISAAIVKLADDKAKHCGFAYGNVCGAPAIHNLPAVINAGPPPSKWDPDSAQPLKIKGSSVTLTPSDTPA